MIGRKHSHQTEKTRERFFNLTEKVGGPCCYHNKYSNGVGGLQKDHMPNKCFLNKKITTSALIFKLLCLNALIGDVSMPAFSPFCFILLVLFEGESSPLHIERRLTFGVAMKGILSIKKEVFKFF